MLTCAESAMFQSLSVRRRQAELIDSPGADPALLRKSFRFIRRINKLLGYTRATLSHLEDFSRRWTPGQTIRVLDLATGSGDIPQAILHWSAQCGFDVRVVGADLLPEAAADAVAECGGRLRLVRAHALNLPFADDSFDYAITNMFLHHLDDDQIVQVLRDMARVARRGVIVADLLRNRRAYAWIVLFTLWANPMVKHDARVSVAQAFTRPEVLSLRDKASLTFTSYHRHFGHRFVLAGEKYRERHAS